MNRYIYLLVAISGLLFGTGCPGKESQSSAGTESIVDATGVSYGAALPQRIISLAPDITANLRIIVPEDRLVGRTDYCNTSKDIPSVGNILEPSIEKIISLKPDIVLATKEGNQPATVTKLRQLGIKVFVFGESNSWQSVQNNFLLLGRLAGEEIKAKKLLNALAARVKDIQTNKRRTESKIFIQLNATPLMTTGNDTFISDIIRHAGARNIADGSVTKWPVFSLEEIIRSDPDMIIISDMGEITKTAQEMWQKFPNLKAVRNNHIYVMKADLLCQPTPDNFVNAVEQILKWKSDIK